MVNVEEKLLENNHFREVLFTGPHSQLVVMSLALSEEIGIPAGTQRNIINTSQQESLKLYTVYSPPEHPDGTVHQNKAEALAYEKEHHH